MRPDGNTLRGPIDAAPSGAVLLSFLDSILLPELRPGDIVVMDHLCAHTMASLRRRIEARGVYVHRTPRYSPK